SIHRAAFVNLGKEQQPQQVQRSWDMFMKLGEHRSVQLPPQPTILDVFDNSTISGKFLILGKPGSGKTTTLLELAEALIERADKDSNSRIPVILELSTWQEVTKWEFPKFWEQRTYDPSIKEWVLSELMTKGVGQEIGEQWLREKELVLLLDRLDELKPERQAKCVRAINQFLSCEFSPAYLVLCSRKEEYEDYEDILQLNEAICLQDLTNEQIRDYFISVNLGEFWESIKGSEKIVNFIRQPLFLELISIAYEQINIEEWRNCNTEESNIDYLLDAYIVQMLDKKKKSKLKIYDDNQLPPVLTTKNRLIKLAKIYELNLFSPSDINLNIINSSLQVIINALPLFFLGFLIVCFAANIPFLDVGKNRLGLFFIIVAFLCFEPEFKEHISTKLLKTIAPQFSIIHSFKLVMLIDVKNIFISTGVKIIEFLGIAWARVSVNRSIQFILHDRLQNVNIPRTTQNPLQKIDKSKKNKALIFWEFLSRVLVFLFVFFIVTTRTLHIFSINLFFYWTVKIIIGIIVATIVAIFLYPLLFLLISPIVFIIILGLELYNLSRRLILRFILGLTGQMPWNITRFLNYCTEHLILQRVGKRYRFIHRLVQEHFANLPIQNK
ncbi:MAG: NACHT domain-containing protein, partial [Planktothrix sp.]